MFYYVKGPVAHIAPYLAVIDCGGGGFARPTTPERLRRGRLCLPYHRQHAFLFEKGRGDKAVYLSPRARGIV